MITKEQVMPMILKSCPSFQEAWDKSDDQELLYVVMGDLARHLLDLYQIGDTEEFSPLCKTIEELHANGDGYVKELATIGILEAIQNVWGHTDTDPEEFCRFLLPESRKWWKELNDFWAGKIPYVGAGQSGQSLELLQPWIPPRDPTALTQEFAREVRHDGLLRGLDLRAIAMRCDCDDVLFEILDGTGRVAVVHLTWSGKTDPNPGWPETHVYTSIAAWRTECMIL